MSLVEEAYQRSIDAMTPAEKFARMIALTAWSRDVIARQIQAEEGPLSEEVLKWKVALWIYGDDPQSRKLIEKALSQVSEI